MSYLTYNVNSIATHPILTTVNIINHPTTPKPTYIHPQSKPNLPPRINHRLPTPTFRHSILPIRITFPSHTPILLDLNKLILEGRPHRQRHSNIPLGVTRGIIIRGQLHRVAGIPLPELRDRSAQVDFFAVGGGD